jgi:hypothetical protein
VTLTVEDNQGNEDSQNVVIFANRPPVARGVVGPTLGEVPHWFGVNGQGSSDPDGQIVDWIWSTYAGSVSDEVTQLVIEKIGVHQVTLEVVDDFGGSDTAKFEVLVGQDFLDTDQSVFHDAIVWNSAKGITKGCNPPMNDRYCPDAFVTRGQMAGFLSRALALTDGVGADLFGDDDGSVFESAIDRLAAAGVTKGCNPPSNDRYCPDDYVTRGQMAGFLKRALGLSDGVGADLFGDDDGSVFESAIDRLATAGVTKGCNPPVNDRYCPDDYVTRGQMAGFLKRALG